MKTTYKNRYGDEFSFSKIDPSHLPVSMFLAVNFLASFNANIKHEYLLLSIS